MNEDTGFFIDSPNNQNKINYVDIWYKAYNIHIEKFNLFKDFIFSVYELVEMTYLGSDVMIHYEDQQSHFTWCWNKVIGDFKKEKIFFTEKGKHYDYFWNFFLEGFYLNKIENIEIKLKESMTNLFDLTIKKTSSELDVLTEFYKLLDQSLKK